MCGLAGYLNTSTSESEDVMRGRLRAMEQTLVHRGPDDGGLWCDPAAGIGFAHRRLAVVDLSAAGHQPMYSDGERYVLAYNGEIYNHEELRLQLDSAGATRWRGHSDTEVILAAIVAWGLHEALQRLVGMFAIALWDRQQRQLTLARDRLGEKPLYYGAFGGTLLFASELKAMRVHPAFRGEVDRDVLSLYVRYGYVPTPHCIYRGVHKLSPGQYLQWSADGSHRQLRAYWSARDVVTRGAARPSPASEAQLADELDGLLRTAVRGQMVADVPLGAFLSGGIDSSTVVALMQVQSTRRIRTFTIGFNESAYDEAPLARAVAAHLDTDHTELYVTPEEARDVIPRLPSMYDEPFADSSQIPTHLVAKLARSQVTVALSGDGGDELFGGYTRYLLARKAWQRLARFPALLRVQLARRLHAIAPPTWNRLLAPLQTVLPGRLRGGRAGDSLHKLGEILALRTLEDVYLRLVSQWNDPAQVVPGSREPAIEMTDAMRDAALHAALPEGQARMMFFDLVGYLPDDILVKVDRAAMAVSLETRIPLLDHRVVEFAWRVPLQHKIQAGAGKRLLRTVLHRYVPARLVERPKMGFGVPIDSWLRGPLRAWAEHLLDPVKLARQGFFAPEPVTALWQEHLSGRRQWQYPLWVVLMFQAWLEETHAG